ncbi:MAG: hypothetical protein DYG88_14205 [Chloroflexi bacterium CFX4]|nr:hypothetical protein [Chloroflexi bacterium CFX4]
MLLLAEPIWESSNMRVGWYDAEQTILVLEVLERWTWGDAVQSIVHVMNPAIVRKAPQPVYSIFVHDRLAKFAPKGGNALQAMRQILQTDPPNEVLAIFVRQTDVIRNFVDVAIRIYRLTNKEPKHRFTNTLEEALAIVAAHKNAAQQPKTANP